MHQTVRLVGKTDVVYEVFTDGEGKIGELRISKGAVDWWPRDSKKQYHRCTWEKLRSFMEELPSRRTA